MRIEKFGTNYFFKIEDSSLHEVCQWLRENKIEFRYTGTQVGTHTYMYIVNESDIPLIGLRWL